MLVNSINDYDPLEEIIVGRADFANIPPVDPSMRSFMYANLTNEEIQKYVGPYNQNLTRGADVNIDFSHYIKRFSDFGLFASNCTVAFLASII